MRTQDKLSVFLHTNEGVLRGRKAVSEEAFATYPGYNMVNING